MSYPFKPKHDILNMEDIIIDTKYAITLNPSKQYKRARLSSQIKNIEEIFQNETYKDICRLSLHPELSSKGRLHFHGTIQISAILRFYRDIVPNLCSNYTVVMKAINADKDWKQYCVKQQHLWSQEYVDRFPIEINNGSVQDKQPEITSFFR